MHAVKMNFWLEIKRFMGMKSWWIGLFLNITFSAATAIIMGFVYNFNPETISVIGIENVSIYLLTGFLMQFLVMTSVMDIPSKFIRMVGFDSFEFVYHYNISVINYIFGFFLGTFVINLALGLPYIIAVFVLVIKTVNIYAALAFVGFLFLSSFCLLSMSLFFSSLFTLTKHFRPFLYALGRVIYFICGVYFPVQGYVNLFGKVWGWISIGVVSIFPYTYVYDLSRYTVFMGQYKLIYPLYLELILLIISSLLFFFLAKVLFDRGIARMKKQGFRSYIY